MQIHFQVFLQNRQSSFKFTKSTHHDVTCMISFFLETGHTLRYFFEITHTVSCYLGTEHVQLSSNQSCYCFFSRKPHKTKSHLTWHENSNFWKCGHVHFPLPWHQKCNFTLSGSRSRPISTQSCNFPFAGSRTCPDSIKPDSTCNFTKFGDRTCPISITVTPDMQFHFFWNLK